MTKQIKKEEMTMDEAIAYLKSIGEWQSAKIFEPQTILKWATFLKDREENQKKTVAKKQKV